MLSLIFMVIDHFPCLNVYSYDSNLQTAFEHSHQYEYLVDLSTKNNICLILVSSVAKTPVLFQLYAYLAYLPSVSFHVSLKPYLLVLHTYLISLASILFLLLAQILKSHYHCAYSVFTLRSSTCNMFSLRAHYHFGCYHSRIGRLSCT